jgi:hypothetical protein
MKPLPHPITVRSERILRHLVLGHLVALGLAGASCSPSPSEPPPPVPYTDTAPVGDGLKVIGYALLGAAVVGVLGRIIR